MCGGRWKKNDPEEPADHALGRSRGGFSTKIHLLCDGDGHPLYFHLTPGEQHESTAFLTVLEGVTRKLPTATASPSPGLSPWQVTRRIAQWIDDALLELGIQPVVPSKSNEDREARSVEFDEEVYRRRNIVERLIGWLKECRRIFSRFEKTAKNFAGMLKMAFIRQYLRLICSS